MHTEPIREENAVHNLEHGYVILYYRADGPQALSVDVLARLAQIAEGKTRCSSRPTQIWKRAPRSRSPLGTGAPADMSPEDAGIMANAFIEARHLERPGGQRRLGQAR